MEFAGCVHIYMYLPICIKNLCHHSDKRFDKVGKKKCQYKISKNQKQWLSQKRNNHAKNEKLVQQKDKWVYKQWTKWSLSIAMLHRQHKKKSILQNVSETQ